MATLTWWSPSRPPVRLVFLDIHSPSTKRTIKLVRCFGLFSILFPMKKLGNDDIHQLDPVVCSVVHRLSFYFVKETPVWPPPVFCAPSRLANFPPFLSKKTSWIQRGMSHGLNPNHDDDNHPIGNARDEWKVRSKCVARW